MAGGDATSRTEQEVAQPEPWVRRHVAAALAEEDADHVLVVGKSLGTRAASYAAERGLDAIWFTPLLVDPALARELADNGCDVLEVPDADHSMGTADAVRTAEIHLEVARAVEAYLSRT